MAVAPFLFETVDLPKVESTEPVNGADAVALDAPLTLTFDRLMDTELTAAAVSTEPTSALAPSWRGSTLVLTPVEPLASGTDYAVTIGREAADVDGNRLQQPITLTFSTVSTGLRVHTQTPADGSAGASPLSPIAIVFDRPIDPGSIAGALTITPPVEGRLEVAGLPRDAAPSAPTAPGSSAAAPSATPVSAPPTGPGSVLLFTPNAPLAGHTTFTVRLRAGAVRSLEHPGRRWPVVDVHDRQHARPAAEPGAVPVAADRHHQRLGDESRWDERAPAHRRADTGDELRRRR